jgi:bacillithiol biosynthesis deacetylase BshB1
MRVLAIGAHPDDLEILCAGTLARYVQQGHQVFMAHVCRGDKGHTEISHAKLGSIREQEAHRAAGVLGAEAMSLDIPDCELFVNDDTMRRMSDLIRTAQPDLIITHHPADYHGDHNAVTKLVLDASFSATLPYYITAHSAHAITPPIFFMDTLAGIDFTPTEYVDITDTLELKKQAMRQHESQFTWLEEHHETDILTLIETRARFRGLQCGAQYAEGFRSMRAWGRLQAERLLP